MLQVQEHQSVAIGSHTQNPKRRGRIALQAYCQEFCGNTDFSTAIDGSLDTTSCQNLKGGLTSTPKTGGHGQNNRDTTCENYCRHRPHWRGHVPGTCSRKAGQHNNLCDVSANLGPMRTVLRKYCLRTCGNSGLTTNQQELCDLACFDDPTTGWELMPNAVEDSICGQPAINAWDCQDTHCTTEFATLQDVIWNSRNQKNRVWKSVVNPGGEFDTFKAACDASLAALPSGTWLDGSEKKHKCRRMNNPAVYDLRLLHLQECSMSSASPAELEACQVMKRDEYFDNDDQGLSGGDTGLPPAPAPAPTVAPLDASYCWMQEGVTHFQSFRALTGKIFFDTLGVGNELAANEKAMFGMFLMTIEDAANKGWVTDVSCP